MAKYFITLVVRFSGAVSSLLLSLIIANRFGAEITGGFYIVLAFYVLGGGVFKFGLDLTVTRLIGESSAYAKVLIRRIFPLYLIVTGFMVLLLFFYSNVIAVAIFRKDALIVPLGIMSPVFLLSGYLSIFSGYLIGLGKATQAFLFSNLLPNLVLVALIGVSDVETLEELALCCLFSYVVSSGLGVMYYLRSCDSLFESSILELKGQKEIVRMSYSYWLISCVNQAVFWGGQLALGIYSSQEIVALYSVAQRVSASVGLILVSINAVSSKRMSRYFFTKNMQGVQKVTSEIFYISALVSVPIFVLLIAYSTEILFFYGEDFLDADLIMKTMLLFNLFCVCTGPVGMLLSLSGKEELLRNISLMFGICSLFFTFLSAVYIGAVGVAFSVGLILFLQNLYMQYRVYFDLKLVVYRKISS